MNEQGRSQQKKLNDAKLGFYACGLFIAIAVIIEIAELLLN